MYSTLRNLYPLLVYSPNTGVSREFTELSRMWHYYYSPLEKLLLSIFIEFVANTSFDGEASLTTSTAYTINDKACVDNLTLSCLDNTIITEWWTLSPFDTSKSSEHVPFLKPSSYQLDISGSSLEMIVYSQRVSPSFLSFVASIGWVYNTLHVIMYGGWVGRTRTTIINAMLEHC